MICIDVEFKKHILLLHFAEEMEKMGWSMPAVSSSLAWTSQYRLDLETRVASTSYSPDDDRQIIGDAQAEQELLDFIKANRDLFVNVPSHQSQELVSPSQNILKYFKDFPSWSEMEKLSDNTFKSKYKNEIISELDSPYSSPYSKPYKWSPYYNTNTSMGPINFIGPDMQEIINTLAKEFLKNSSSTPEEKKD